MYGIQRNSLAATRSLTISVRSAIAALCARGQSLAALADEQIRRPGPSGRFDYRGWPRHPVLA